VKKQTTSRIISARVPIQELTLVRTAAALDGVTVQEFILRHVLPRARERVMEAATAGDEGGVREA
jgi:uncharacterized protein (DUF1778 family)